MSATDFVESSLTPARAPDPLTPQVSNTRVAHPEEARSEIWRFETSPGAGIYRILLATTAELRRRADAIVTSVYAAQQYNNPAGAQRAACRLASTLLITAPDGSDVATATLIPDSPNGLPCDEIYRQEVDALRREGHGVVEVTRLVTCGGGADRAAVILHLLSFVYIGSCFMLGARDVVIEVNPRHEGYYQRALQFERIGPERACPRVGGAPAVLLRARDPRSIGGPPESMRHKSAYTVLTLAEMDAVSGRMARLWLPEMVARAVG
jgi:hypothetical protein